MITDLRIFPEHIERSLVTPHEHEGKRNKPLWLIWKVESARTGVPYFPILDTVCDTEESARYHVAMLLDDSDRQKDVYGQEIFVAVERIPANHRFGSSLGDLQMKTHLALWRARTSD